ncbi:UNVERIFIED_ORG: ABC-type sugar transport system ATPase subunit [Ensifer adhaerens]|nr:ABC-type sugar transport system ATPase subunit [Ensifer adhaerens]
MLPRSVFSDLVSAAGFGSSQSQLFRVSDGGQESAAFLFDEPLSDAKLRGQMRIEIKRLQRSLGTRSAYVTHAQMEAMTLADKVVVVNGGQIEQVRSPIELYKNRQWRLSQPSSDHRR